MEKINERMLASVESKSGTVKASYNVVEEELEFLNILLTNLIRESFYGAASMSGFCNGFQTHLKKELHLNLIYTLPRSRIEPYSI
jgi:hypothetical protein